MPEQVPSFRWGVPRLGKPGNNRAAAESRQYESPRCHAQSLRAAVPYQKSPSFHGLEECDVRCTENANPGLCPRSKKGCKRLTLRTAQHHGGNTRRDSTSSQPHRRPALRAARAFSSTQPPLARIAGTRANAYERAPTAGPRHLRAPVADGALFLSPNLPTVLAGVRARER